MSHSHPSTTLPPLKCSNILLAHNQDSYCSVAHIPHHKTDKLKVKNNSHNLYLAHHTADIHQMDQGSSNPDIHPSNQSQKSKVVLPHMMYSYLFILHMSRTDYHMPHIIHLLLLSHPGIQAHSYHCRGLLCWSN